MVISINPISIQIGQSTCVMSLKCIPKSYLKDKTISDLKELCSDLNNVDNSSKGDIVHSSIRENDKIMIFNYQEEGKSIFPFIKLLNWLIDNIKYNFEILNKDLLFFKNNILVFNLLELEFFGGYKTEDYILPIFKQVLDTTIEIIYEQFIYKFEKRTASKLVRNYVEYRYNPKYKFCQYILNKQYDEAFGKEINQQVKKIKLN